MGFSQAAGKKILIEVACRPNGFITYSELVAEITALRLEPYDSRLFHLLGEISSEENAAGRGMLTAIVLHKNGDMLPGKGFFELAKCLGYNTKNSEAFWVEESKKVHEYWANQIRQT